MSASIGSAAGTAGAAGDPASGRPAAADEARAALATQGAPGLAVRRVDDGCPLSLWLAWRGAGPPLADVVPMLANLGLRAEDQHPLESAGPGDGCATGDTVSVDEYRILGPPELATQALAQVGELGETLRAIWAGRADSDPLDRLVLTAGLAAGEVALLRALLRYLLHAGLPLSEAYGHRMLTARASFARDLVALFHARMRPGAEDPDGAADLAASLDRDLDTVAGVDEDLLLTRLRDVVLAVVRTTYYLPGEALAVKLDPGRLRWLPRPLPAAEVFVSTARFDALHLRAGLVARGGIRWSDRTEDLRAEIAGLMKAQRVKNALIVPDGAKGGYVLRHPPDDPRRREAEGRACYATFIRALLALTDNRVDGATVRRPGLVCHDGEDSYLVVAADKGTARFSDLANAIAVESGYWLGDAFASGGRTGYDHKALGITARGVWESVRRHFAELGVDADAEPITVVGIGDMSGDVFGNGLLQSDQLRLVAAFDHRHLFLDPDPDPDRSYAQRRRLAALPTSSWDDYDRSALSAGGGVFPLSARRVPLSPQIRARLRVDAESLTVDELIRSILRAPVDLLWNGGIGTWVKASREDHQAVGDKARDRCRVDASELRAKVVAEGGNLGLTEAARVEYCLAGGRCNTDFIDNSAGVDCSDREVNLKIGLAAAGRVPGPIGGSSPGTAPVGPSGRDDLLAAATGEVVQLVLADSARQVLSLSVSERQAAVSVEGMARLTGHLVSAGILDPSVDPVPDQEVMRARMGRGPVLTRPEIAILHAYGKREVFGELVGSDLLAEPATAETLDAYLPATLRPLIGPRFDRHPLWRAIAASQLANDLVDRVGAGFLFRLEELTGAPPVDGVRAFLITRDLFGLAWVWEAVDGHHQPAAGTPCRARRRGDVPGGDRVDAAVEALLRCRMLQEYAAQWLLRRRPRPLDLTAETMRYYDGVSEVAMALPETLRRLGAREELDAIETVRRRLLGAGLPLRAAEQVARLKAMVNALDIVDVALQHDIAVTEVLTEYFDLGVRLGLGRLTTRIVDRPGDSYWETMAKASLRSKLASSHARLVEALLARAGGDLDTAVRRTARSGGVSRVRAVVDEVAEAPEVTSAMVAAVVLRLDDLADLVP
ncbi:NAD-glutamate dehydrogenase [Frankia tisae]|uniref:NAD-glutamate dehydrogenase n=1 Tax=Frankia tisae TaxID=2950104 RepID=UPI0021C06FE1|nr:NAD-glutamate dehydrogenase [Frankia tisae]